MTNQATETKRERGKSQAGCAASAACLLTLPHPRYGGQPDWAEPVAVAADETGRPAGAIVSRPGLRCWDSMLRELIEVCRVNHANGHPKAPLSPSHPGLARAA